MRIYLVIVGSLCLVASLALMIRRLHVLVGGITAIGTVIGHEARTTDESESFLPMVRFRDQRGTEFEFTSVAGRATRHPRPGSLALVRYLPSNPKIAYIGTFLHMWAAPLALAVLGAAGLAALWLK